MRSAVIQPRHSATPIDSLHLLATKMIVVIWSQENFHIGVKHEPAAYSRNRNVVARRNLGDRRDEFIALGRGSGEQHLHRSIHADHDMVHPRWHCLGSS